MTTFFNRLKDSKAIRTKSISYENNIAKITLTDTTEQTEGTYTCRASNEAGSVETNCKLSIQGEFLFEFFKYRSEPFYGRVWKWVLWTFLKSL